MWSTPFVVGVNPSSPPNEAGTVAGSGVCLPATVADTLDSLAEIGRASHGGGISRLAWSAELFAAYDWIGERMRALGLDVEIDPAGNLIGRWHVGAGAPVAVGSHLDTVPSGGAFDGAYGVVAALHAVRLLQEQGFTPDRPLWVVAFMDEEGTRFGSALFGSRAFVGEDVADFGDRVDADGTSLRDAMREAGFDFDRVALAAAVSEIASYVELHVEQGPVLEAEGLDIGVVTSVVGLRGYRVELRGEANHAGTTPMGLRRDALAGAARITLALREFARRHADMTANVGNVCIAPGGANVVPGHADFTVDARAATGDGIVALQRAVEQIVSSVAEEESLDAVLESTFTLEPVQLDAELMAAVERAAETEGAASKRMASGAGHDAMLIARHVPAAIIFVPSRGGISHAPEEYTAPEQVESGMRVLAATLRQILRQER